MKTKFKDWGRSRPLNFLSESYLLLPFRIEFRRTSLLIVLTRMQVAETPFVFPCRLHFDELVTSSCILVAGYISQPNKSLLLFMFPPPLPGVR